MNQMSVKSTRPIPVSAYRVLLSGAMALIAVSAWMLPADLTHGPLAPLAAVLKGIPDVGHETQRSHMPQATAITYGLGLILGALAALLLLATNLNRAPGLEFVRKRGPVARAGIAFFFGALAAAPYCIPLEVSRSQVTSSLNVAMADSRFVLACWGEAAFLFQLVAWSIAAFTVLSYSQSKQ